MRLVLDASVAVAAARPSEPFHASSRARVDGVLRGRDQIVVPSIFAIEVGSALARTGMAPDTTRDYVDELLALAERIHTIGPVAARRIRDVAIAARLRAADSAYVWLASREGLPLCTLDQEVVQRGAVWCAVIPP